MSHAEPAIRAHRAAVLHFRRAPRDDQDWAAADFFADGLLVVRDGRIDSLGPAADLLPGLGADVSVVEHPGCMIMPGFIDTHIHFPQTDIIASYGKHLLDWLEAYTYPAESRFHDPDYAHSVAAFFTDELLRNGTTTAMVFGTVHPESVNAVLAAAQARNMRMIAGKVLMDRHCPPALRDTPESGYQQSRALIERWHNVDRLHYAVTPRFAPTSTPMQLEKAGQLLREFPDVFMQTHLAENRREVEWVAQLNPDARSYLDVYDRVGIVRDRSVFAHCIYIDDHDREVMAARHAAMSFCPTSNLFLGSGLFDVHRACAAGVHVGIGTDVGAGTSFSMLRTLGDAYKVAKLNGRGLEVQRAFYLATLGAARALRLDDRIGNFEPGKEADFVVLNFAASEVMRRRLDKVHDLTERLFALMILGDDRSIAATYIMGEAAFARDAGQDAN